MVSLYEYAHEIKKATGWSQERLGAETGLGLSTISRILRIPGYQGNETSRVLLEQLHNEVIHSPFPSYLQKLFKQYDTAKERLSKKEFTLQIEALEPLLLNHRALPQKTLEACRLCWLLGHIEYDRTFYLKQNPATSADKALTHYQNALDILDAHRDPHLLIQGYKLRQCLVSTLFNQCQAGTRHDSEAVRDWLRRMDYLTIVAAVIAEEPWNWVAARNGLVAASILQNTERCLDFWHALQQMHRQFSDPGFQPAQDQAPILQDPDLAWFVAKVVKQKG